ncbi:MAG: TIGR03084 family metal-binding protein, partial [Aquihabitans sp.]
MADVRVLLDDLSAEGDDLDALVSALSPERWRSETPAEGWTVAHQIGHLAWTDAATLLAVTDADSFNRMLEAAMAEAETFVDRGADEWANLTPDEILARWRTGRQALVDALGAVPDGTRLPWFGPPMSAASMTTARIMETWAHGQDVADALGIERTATDRLRNVAHIGVRTRDFAYAINAIDPPAEPFRYELTSPSGEIWTWGPDDANQRISGPALDFCLLVTQRRHLDDLVLVADGADAQA